MEFCSIEVRKFSIVALEGSFRGSTRVLFKVRVLQACL